jgi:membrane protease YdiL (CAAX protease family)
VIERVRAYVNEQFRLIDEDYKDPAAPRSEAAWILVAVAVSLLVGRYYGSDTFIRHKPGAKEFFDALPATNIYPMLYWGAFKLVSYGLLPVLCIRVVIKKNITDYGLRFVHEPRVWLLYAALLAIALPLAYAAAHHDDFLATYPKYRFAGRSWQEFVAWETAYGFQFFMLEFFFRGFLTFALARHIGALAVFVMIVPYSMIHYGKPIAECVGSIAAGTVLGTIALRTRSIYGGVVVHCGVAWAMDVFAIVQSSRLP